MSITKPEDMQDKIAKTKVIESMLRELGMSRSELVELIRAITQQSVAEDKGQGISASDVTQLDDKDRGVNISIEEFSAQLAAGNIEVLQQYLSVEQVKNLAIKLGFAFNLKRARELGLVLDTALVTRILSIKAISTLALDGTYEAAGGKKQALSTQQAEDMGKSLTAMINNRSAARSSGNQQAAMEIARATNDQNSFSNPNSSINIVKRLFNAVQQQVRNISDTANSTISARVNLAVQQQLVNNVQNISGQVRRSERALRRLLPEVGKTRRGEGALMATISTERSGSREVNLKDHLRSEGRLTPKLEKMIDKISSLNDKLDNGLKDLSRGMPEANSFQFDASGKLQANVESSNMHKLVLVVDYISDMRRELSRMKDKVENRKGEMELKKNMMNNEGNAEKERLLTRGPDLDGSNTQLSKAAADALALKVAAMVQPADSQLLGGDEKKERKESKRADSELIKLDAMHDRMKMMEAMKGTGEMKQIESSMKEVMKDMKDAEKNKDLLKDMQLKSKGRNLDK